MKDTVYLHVLLIIATIVILIFPLNLLTATIILFGGPCIYLTFRAPRHSVRAGVYAVVVTVISLLTDYLAEMDNSWVSTTMFAHKVAGIVPIEALVWMFLFTYLIVMFYLFMLKRPVESILSGRMRYVIGAALAVLLFMTYVSLTNRHFTFSYYYIIFGTACIAGPLLLFTLKFPSYVKVYIKITPYFFVLGLVNVLTSLHKGHWSYPGNHFIGWIPLGRLSFPIEELVFWIILFPSFLVTQFDFFNSTFFAIGNNKKSE